MGNGIVSVDDNAFKGLANLTELNMAYNNIALIETNTFKSLFNFTDLNMRGYQIKVKSTNCRKLLKAFKVYKPICPKNFRHYQK